MCPEELMGVIYDLGGVAAGGMAIAESVLELAMGTSTSNLGGRRRLSLTNTTERHRLPPPLPSPPRV